MLLVMVAARVFSMSPRCARDVQSNELIHWYMTLEGGPFNYQFRHDVFDHFVLDVVDTFLVVQSGNVEGIRISIC